MKTLYRSMRNCTGKEMLAKRAELEAETGLKLSCYHTGDGANFSPYLHNLIRADDTNAQKILACVPVGVTGIAFTSISQKTGLAIMQVLEGIQWLCKNNLVLPDVGRDGRMVGAHKNK
jgi:hypothetical protein